MQFVLLKSIRVKVETMKRILIADDEIELINSMAFTLKRKGFEISKATNGLSAFEQISETCKNNNPFDLIITDIQMPGLSGIELIKKIREAKITTPILVITGFESSKLKKNILQIGCSNYLEKPFNLNDFTERISILIGDI